MNYPVVFSTLAEQELMDQLTYLEDKKQGQARTFSQALRRILEEVGNNPERYAPTIVRPDLRCIRFPKPFQKSHSIYYHFDGQRVRILCISPNKRSEKIWQGRK